MTHDEFDLLVQRVTVVPITAGAVGAAGISADEAASLLDYCGKSPDRVQALPVGVILALVQALLPLFGIDLSGGVWRSLMDLLAKFLGK